MCGRFTLAMDLEDLMDFFQMQSLDFGVPYRPRYNIAPTTAVLTYGADGPSTGDMMRWGLLPSPRFRPRPDASAGIRPSRAPLPPGQRRPKPPLIINARAESVATNRMFREPFERRRCLVLADGYYEWAGPEKRPFRIGMKGWEPFGLAALWERWEGPEGPARSCTIITTAANELTAPIHDRMPVLLPPEARERWLDPDNTTGEGLTELLVPFDPGAMAAYEVSSRVNAVRNDDASLIEPASEPRQGTLDL